MVIVVENIEYYYFSNTVYWKNNEYPISPIYNNEHSELELDIPVETEHRETAPMVSVIMTTFNCSKYLYTSIPSILQQTCDDFEFIIVDDCSTDNTVSIVSLYQSKDPRVKLIRNDTNKGCYVSKNIGINQAKGTWITFQDADDYSNSERFEKQLSFCVQNRLEACYCEFLSRKTKKKSLVEISLFINRVALDKKLGYFDSVRFGADTEMRERIIRLGMKYAILKENLYHCVDRYVDMNGRNDSLTNNVKTNLASDIRKKYRLSFSFFHKNATSPNQLKYPFPQTQRSFTVYGMNEEEKNLLT